MLAQAALLEFRHDVDAHQLCRIAAAGDDAFAHQVLPVQDAPHMEHRAHLQILQVLRGDVAQAIQAQTLHQADHLLGGVQRQGNDGAVEHLRADLGGDVQLHQIL